MRKTFIATIVLIACCLARSALAACSGIVAGTVFLPVGSSTLLTPLDQSCVAITPSAALTATFNPSPAGSLTGVWNATGFLVTAVAPGGGTVTFFDTLNAGASTSVQFVVPNPFTFGGVIKTP